MTNKALAELIQQGGNDELLPVLWEKTAKLLYKISARTHPHTRTPWSSTAFIQKAITCRWGC